MLFQRDMSFLVQSKMASARQVFIWEIQVKLSNMCIKVHQTNMTMRHDGVKCEGMQVMINGWRQGCEVADGQRASRPRLL